MYLILFIFGFIFYLEMSFILCLEHNETSDFLEQFEMHPFYYGSRIQLNITRKNVSNDDPHQMYPFNISLLTDYANYNYCEQFDDNPVMVLDLMNQTFILPQPEESNHSLFRDCNYTIFIKTLNDAYEYKYRLPDCVDGCQKCSVSLLDLKYVEPFAEMYYKVYFNYSTELREPTNLTVINIDYVEKSTGNRLAAYLSESEYLPGALLLFMPHVKTEKQYELQVYLNVNDTTPFVCDYMSSIVFQLEGQNNNRIYFFSAILTSFSMMILLYFILHKMRWMDKITESCKYCLNGRQQVQEIANLRYSFQTTNSLYSSNFHSDPDNDDPYEFPRKKIQIKDFIAEGAFGIVYYAKAIELYGIPGYTIVAVKQLREGAPTEEVADFLAEINMLKKIGVHKNIVKLLACVTKDKPYMMVMELVFRGALKEYLLNLRDMWMKKTSMFYFSTSKNNKISLNRSRENKYSNFNDCSDGAYITPSVVQYYKEVREKDLEEGTFLLDKTVSQSNPSTSQQPSNYLPNTMPELLAQFVDNNKNLHPLQSKIILTGDIENYEADSITPRLPDVVHFSHPIPVLDHKELENFALQIATGMAYLESIGVTHRDLAARNILVTRQKVLKITDFGMSRMGTYVNSKQKKVPLRWMAIEAVELLKSDSKSDVWSFGVVLWEIGTLGAFPYRDIEDNYVLLALKKGKRLERPEICTDKLYEIMKKCWNKNPDKRPSFKELVETLSTKVKHTYVEFSRINPEYVFPPALDDPDAK